jgi:hypothetical protein
MLNWLSNRKHAFSLNVPIIKKTHIDNNKLLHRVDKEDIQKKII